MPQTDLNNIPEEKIDLEYRPAFMRPIDIADHPRLCMCQKCKEHYEE